MHQHIVHVLSQSNYKNHSLQVQDYISTGQTSLSTLKQASISWRQKGNTALLVQGSNLRSLPSHDKTRVQVHDVLMKSLLYISLLTLFHKSKEFLPFFVLVLTLL